jgi:hypothetical protein
MQIFRLAITIGRNLAQHSVIILTNWSHIEIISDAHSEMQIPHWKS